MHLHPNNALVGTSQGAKCLSNASVGTPRGITIMTSFICNCRREILLCSILSGWLPNIVGLRAGRNECHEKDASVQESSSWFLSSLLITYQ